MFFRNPKTGCSAAEIILRMCNTLGLDDIATVLTLCGLPSINSKIDPENKAVLGDETFNAAILESHLTPLEAVERGYCTLDQLQEFDCYFFLREPEARLMSAFKHMFRPAYPEIFQGLHNGTYELKLVGEPQHRFTAPGVTPLLCDDFKANLDMMCRKIGHPGFPLVPHFNKTQNGLSVGEKYWNVETRKWYLKTYADDIALYKTIKAERDYVWAA